MSEPPADGTVAGKPQTARGRELDLPDWLRLPARDRYAAATRKAAAERRTRALSAGQAAVELAGRVAGAGSRPRMAGDQMWEVRGQFRRRETFGYPHPGDFPGGLPAPREYPA